MESIGPLLAYQFASSASSLFHSLLGGGETTTASTIQDKVDLSGEDEPTPFPGGLPQEGLGGSFATPPPSWEGSFGYRDHYDDPSQLPPGSL